MIEDVTRDADKRMQKAVEALKQTLTRLRTGRANTALLDHITVEYYGSQMPLNQVSNVTVQDARTLMISPWDKNMVGPIEKAILASDLGLTPTTAGTVIRIPLPPLTEERRRDLTKVVRHEAENARVAIRNVRRDAMQMLKDLVREKEISEDDERRAHERVQKLTDDYIARVEESMARKEKELLEV